MYIFTKITITIFILYQSLYILSNNDISYSDKFIVNVKDLGAKGDGIQNDYPAFKNAVDLINTNQGGTLVIPHGVYYFDNYNSPTSNYDLKFVNLKNLKIEGNNSIINLNGNFKRKITRVSRKNKFSKIRTLVPLHIVDSKNIVIKDLELNGNVQQTTRDNSIVEAPGHLLIINECSNVDLLNLKLHHSMADGLLIKGKSKPSKNIIVDNVICSNNARQGITLGFSNHIVFNNCIFQNTGITQGNYKAHPPKAGLDIEPNHTYQKIHDITFSQCKFINNLGSAIVVNHVNTTNGVLFEDCYFEASKKTEKKWSVIVNAKNVEFKNCQFKLYHTSIYPVWHKPGSSAYFYKCKISSSDAGIVAVSKNNESSVIVDSCTLIYSGEGVIRRYFPYIRMKNLVFTNNQIIIPKNRRKEKRFDGLIQNIKHYEGNIIKSSIDSSTPKISLKNSNVRN